MLYAPRGRYFSSARPLVLKINCTFAAKIYVTMQGENISVKSTRAMEWQLAVTYGLPLGVLWVAIFLFTVWTEMYKMPIWMQLINWVGSFAIVYLCIREYRRHFENPTDMKFGRAVRVGFFQALIAALIYALTTWILIKYVYVDYIANVLEEAYNVMVETVGDSDIADKQYELMEKMYQPWLMLVTFFANGLLSGLIYALIASAILRRKPREVNPFQ